MARGADALDRAAKKLEEALTLLMKAGYDHWFEQLSQITHEVKEEKNSLLAEKVL